MTGALKLGLDEFGPDWGKEPSDAQIAELAGALFAGQNRRRIFSSGNLEGNEGRTLLSVDRVVPPTLFARELASVFYDTVNGEDGPSRRFVAAAIEVLELHFETGHQSPNVGLDGGVMTAEIPGQIPSSLWPTVLTLTRNPGRADSHTMSFSLRYVEPALGGQ